ncbi:MAG TPA: DUF222 domain-containing protein [Aeromicrobium sp.]|nr:DUF222 domain-containing protein [Aeromicrobium sp.]
MNSDPRLAEPWLSGAPESLDAVRAADLDSLTAEELVRFAAHGQAIVRAAQAMCLALTSAGARKEAHKAAGAGSMASLVAAEAGLSRRGAARHLKLAAQLDEAPVLAEQLSKPGMSTDKATVVAKALADLPIDLTAAERSAVETDLAEAAPGMLLEQLQHKARRAVEVVDRERADRIENQELVRQEEVAVQAAEFWMTRPDEAGMVKGGFTLDALTADMLRSALEAKTSPRRRNSVLDTDTGELTFEDATLDSPPSYKERAGNAFADLLRHLPTGEFGNHGGVAATLMITISEDSLRGRCDQSGVTEHGTRVSAGQLRQLACGAGVLPAVLGSKSQVLDLGRDQRLHSPAQRRALAHRDLGCAFPDCDRPPGWTETHHIKSWLHDGPTDLDNGVLLCGHHHRQVHHSGWRIELNPRDKRPDFYPPGASQPRRNTRYRPLVA